MPSDHMLSGGLQATVDDDGLVELLVPDTDGYRRYHLSPSFVLADIIRILPVVQQALWQAAP